MEDQERQILTDLINSLKTDVINSMQAKGRFASGETIAALETAEIDEQIQLLAPWWIDALEVGRQPTSPNAPAGDPTVFEEIQKWIAAKGLDLNPYAVTKNIHKKGYPGKPGVLTEPLYDYNVDQRATEAAENLASLIIESTFKLYDSSNP